MSGMKFRIYLTSNRKPVPYNYAHTLCSAFHRLLGPNDLHDMLSLYSLGWLKGEAKAGNSGLNFPRGGSWDIGIFHSDIAERLIRGVLLQDLPICFGMKVRRVELLTPPKANKHNRYRFLAASPVLLRRVEDDGSRTHVTYDDPQSAAILTRLLRKKMKEAELEADSNTVRVYFDGNFPHPKTKLIDIKGIKNKASVCPVIVEGSPKVQEFAWTVGAGELTGIGFGSLNHTDPLS